MGDTSLVDFWADADIYYTTDLGAPAPTVGNPFSIAWRQVGILDGEDGFTTAREEESTDHYGWGTFIGTRRRNFKETFSFVALETNPYTRALRYPGSNPGEIRQPDRSIVYKIGIEKREGAKVYRRISKNRCDITLDGDVSENETDPTKLTFLVTPIPDSAGVYWIEQGGPVDPTTPSALTLAGASSVGNNKIDRVTASATFPAPTGVIDVTDAASWSSSNTTLLDVYPGGFVKAKAASGTVTVTAKFLGLTETRSITLTA